MYAAMYENKKWGRVTGTSLDEIATKTKRGGVLPATSLDEKVGPVTVLNWYQIRVL